MLRSCYSVDMRLFQGDPSTTRVNWYFTAPDAPWLPVATVFNSLNWVDERARIDQGLVGEVPGTAKYSLGAAPAWAQANGYCGTNLEWLGQQVPLEAPPELDYLGGRLCCKNPPQPPIVVEVSHASPFLEVQVIGGHYIDTTMSVTQKSWFAQMVLQPMAPTGFYDIPWQVDLLADAPPVGALTLADVILTTFPGYASQEFWMPSVQIEDAIPNAMVGDCGPFHFQCTRNVTGPAKRVVGWVMSDTQGFILTYAVSSTVWLIQNQGDYVDVVFKLACNFNEP